MSEFTGLILPIVSSILASLTLGGFMWPGYVVGVLGVFTVGISASVMTIVSSSKQLNVALGSVEMAINALAAGMLIFSGWFIPAFCFFMSVVFDAALFFVMTK